MRTAFGVLVLAFVVAGCPEAVPECSTGAECASGACRADGTCVPVESGAGGDAGYTGGTGGLDAVISGDAGSGGSGGDADAGAGTAADVAPDGAAAADTGVDVGGGPGADGGPGEDTGGTDGGTGGPDAVGPDAGGGLCAPNHDGIVTRDEMPIGAGLHATYRVATGVDWSTAGKQVADGSREWDLTVTFPGEANTLVEARPLEGTWFEGDFPDATYAARLSETEDLLGVFRVEDDGLYLLGVASMEDSLTATNLSYDPPVQVLQFPMEEGDVWETDSTITGTAVGIWSFYTEGYRSEVDAHGTMKTPFGDFDVLRVNVELTRTIGVLPTTVRTHMFIAECFGTVANVVSEDHEIGDEFDAVKELRRLAP